MSQAILAPGGVDNLRRRVGAYLTLDTTHPNRVLELGCGTGYFSIQRPDVSYIGTDLNAAYFPVQSPGAGMSYQVMDATRLDFPDGSFDLVYSIGLYHHLSDSQVIASLRESRRVLAPGGRILLVDNIWPTHWWNALAWIIRRLDRGGHVRSPEQIDSLVRASQLTIQSKARFFYTATGLEAVILQLTAPA